LVRGCASSGLPKNSSFEQSSDLAAHVHEDHAVADLAGKAHLVGHAHHGHALLGQPTITSSTSPTISGSSAEVGSSNSITMGSMRQRARNGHALLLAARELAGELVLVRHQAHAVEHLQAALLGIVGRCGPAP
jgi:hypothetical protein